MYYSVHLPLTLKKHVLYLRLIDSAWDYAVKIHMLTSSLTKLSSINQQFVETINNCTAKNSIDCVKIVYKHHTLTKTAVRSITYNCCQFFEMISVSISIECRYQAADEQRANFRTSMWFECCKRTQKIVFAFPTIAQYDQVASYHTL